MIGLYDTFKELDILNEANRIKFDRANLAPSENSIFKFLSSIQDLNSAIQSRLVWTNARTDGLQFDEYCDKLNKETGYEWGFISLTAEPTKVALELRRPFGIEWDLDKLTTGVEKLGYKYRAFNILDSAKAISNKIKEKDLAKLNAVGIRKDGSYWMALQGQYEPRDISKETYDKLLNWLKANSGGDQLVHFVFDDRDPLATAKTTKYKYTVSDFIDEEGSQAILTRSIDDNGREDTRLSNKNFLPFAFGGVGFNSNIREMSEIWATCLNRAIGLNTQSGEKYKSHIYNQSVKPLYLNSVTGVDYALDKDTSIELAEILDEYEYRIYIPDTKIFKYDISWIRSIRLPDYYGFKFGDSRVDRDVALVDIFEAFNTAVDTTDEALINICNELGVSNEQHNEEIVRLYRLLKNNDLLDKCIFFNYATMEQRKSKPKYVPNPLKNQLDDLPDNKGNYGTDHRTRFTISKSVLASVFGQSVGTRADVADERYRVIKLVDKAGNPSLIYKDFPSKRGVENARLEVRGAILAKDENNQLYINVITKGPSFDELPGGSFDRLPSNESDLKAIAAEKFEKETGIKISSQDLNLMNDLTYAYEDVNKYIKALTKDTNLTYAITVDWTFVALLDTVIDTTTKKINEDGYSKWLLLDHAFVSNNNFMLRYRNIAPLLKQYAEIATNRNTKRID